MPRDLGFTVCNDLVAHRVTAAAGKPALINSAFGLVLVLVGAPIDWFYRWRRKSRRDDPVEE
jgi:hypothetical protein